MKLLGAMLFTLVACARPQPEARGPMLGESTAEGPSSPSAPLAVAPRPRPVSSGALHGPALPGGPGDPAPAATYDANNPEPSTLSPPDPQDASDNGGAGSVFAPGLVVGPTGRQAPIAAPPTSTNPGATNAPISAPQSPAPAPAGPGTGNAPITQPR